MKRLLLFFAVSLVVIFATSVVYGAMTNTLDGRVTGRWWTNNPGNVGVLWGREVETTIETFTLDSDSYITIPSLGYIILTAHDTEPGTTEGMVYWDNSENSMKVYNGSGWIALSTGTGDNTLDNAYDQPTGGAGKKVDVDTGVIEFEVDDGSNNGALHLDCDDTNGLSCLLIENAATGSTAIGVDIDGQAGGRDIEGTAAAWYVVGDGTLVALDANFTGASGIDVQGAGGITLENDETITNSTDSRFDFTSSSEDIRFQLKINEIELSSSTNVTTFDFGTVQYLDSILEIDFEPSPCYLDLTADGSGDDLNIRVLGSQDASLKLLSNGTGADSVILESLAGGVDILASGAATGEDIDIVATGSSVNIEATEGVADGIVIKTTTAAGGIDISSQADIDIVTAGAGGEDITITNTGGSLVMSATEDNVGCVSITENGGSTACVIIRADQGTAVLENASSITLLSDDGGISIHSEADLDKSIKIIADGGVDETIIIQSDLGTGDDTIILLSDAGGIDVDAAKSINIASSENTTDAIRLNASAGGIDIDSAGGSAEDIDVNSAAGSIRIQANEDVADSVYIRAATGGIDVFADGASAKDIDVNCVNGSTNISGGEDVANAVVLRTTAGGIDIDATGEAAQDIDVNNTGGSVRIQATEDVADAVYIRASAGGIEIYADGAAARDVNVTCDNGSINVTSTEDAAAAVYLHANGGTSETVKIHADQGDTTTSVNIVSDAGGVTLNGAKGVIVASSLVMNAVQTFTDTDTTPDVGGYTYWNTNTTGATITDFDGANLQTGQLLIVESKGAIVYDVTGNAEMEGGTTDLTTADGDMTYWIYNGTEWKLLFFMDMSDNLS